MCLDTITSTRTGTNLAVTKVWKQFRLNRTAVCPTCRYENESVDKKDWNLYCGWALEVYPEDKIGIWIKASKGRIVMDDENSKYPQGFHAYARELRLPWPHNTKRNRIPVEFRCIHTVGTQSGEKVLVAYEMRIPKNWRKYVR
jgi:hypothetical protein